MADDTRWMTYAELAQLLGIGGDSARNLVRRRRWPRQPGNDGLARVGVPVNYISEHGASDGEAEPPINFPTDVPADGGAVLGILTRHISRLERELENLKEERDVERQGFDKEIQALRDALEVERLRGAQIEALNAVIEAERQRVEDLRRDRDALQDDRDRWAAQPDKLVAMRRSWWPWQRRA